MFSRLSGLTVIQSDQIDDFFSLMRSQPTSSVSTSSKLCGVLKLAGVNLVDVTSSSLAVNQLIQLHLPLSSILFTTTTSHSFDLSSRWIISTNWLAASRHKLQSSTMVSLRSLLMFKTELTTCSIRRLCSTSSSHTNPETRFAGRSLCSNSNRSLRSRE